MLEALDLRFRYQGTSAALLDGVTLAIPPCEVIGLLGASGSGKTTLARLLAGYLQPSSGVVRCDRAALRTGAICPVQMLFQTPERAVNPRWRIERILTEVHRPDPDMRRAFGLQDAWLRRFPHEISSGELQRVAIVRALAPPVRTIVADEMTSMLDSIAQVEIWQALLAVATERRLGVLAISHNRALLERLASKLFRLDKGRLLPCYVSDDAIQRGEERLADDGAGAGVGRLWGMPQRSKGTALMMSLDPHTTGWLWAEINKALRFYLAPIIWLWKLYHR